MFDTLSPVYLCPFPFSIFCISCSSVIISWSGFGSLVSENVSFWTFGVSGVKFSSAGILAISAKDYLSSWFALSISSEHCCANSIPSTEVSPCSSTSDIVSVNDYEPSVFCVSSELDATAAPPFSSQSGGFSGSNWSSPSTYSPSSSMFSQKRSPGSMSSSFSSSSGLDSSCYCYAYSASLCCSCSSMSFSKSLFSPSSRLG